LIPAERMQELLERGRQTRPALEADQAFRERLSVLAQKQGGIPEPFAAADFYLVAAFAQGSERALAELRELLKRCVESAGARLSRADREDVLSELSIELFTEAKGRPPSVLNYGGRGGLAAFIMVAVARRVTRVRHHAQREAPVGDDALLGSLSDGPGDTEGLALLKQRYGAQVSRCLGSAVASLQPRDRLLLRQHYLDELSLEVLAEVHAVHRATVARWLADARTSLLEGTRGELGRLFGIQRSEVDSLIRAVESRLDISARLFLGHDG
jgi:RNA polymerase sigma-70 factor (ECF subfamily)